MSKKTICQLVQQAYGQYEDNLLLTETLIQIKEKASAMEDRLLKYCNAIETLGFSRDGRDYDKQ
jgi:hypothetical protein